VNRDKLLGGVGALLVAALVAAFTHYLDDAAWSRQHAVERQEYRQLQAEKVFDSVTTVISRFIAAAEAINIYKQDAIPKDKGLLNEALLQRQLDFETAFPLERLMVKLYFSDSTYTAFDRTFALVGSSYTETQQNLRPGAAQNMASLKALTRQLELVASMMAAELTNGMEK
jgi:hypothetical protein